MEAIPGQVIMIKIHARFHKVKVPPVNDTPKIITHSRVGTERIIWVIHCMIISAFDPANEP